MAKFLIFLVLCGLMTIIKAQDETATVSVIETTLSPEQKALLFKDVTNKIISKQLSTANLPPELATAGQQVLLDISNNLAQCEENLKTNHLIWQYKICSATQIRNTLNAIRALKLASLQPAAAPLGAQPAIAA